jgi:alpha-tubulin suppressor-like RCC1 family protein
MNDKNIKDIICGDNHTIIHKTNGEIWGFGKNDSYQLNFGNIFDRYIKKPMLLMTDENIKKIYCGFEYTLLLKNNGDVYGCGNNYCNRFGIKTKCKCDLTLLPFNNVKNIYCDIFCIIINKNDESFIGYGWPVLIYMIICLIEY